MRLAVIALIACAACGDPELIALFEQGGSSTNQPFESEEILPASGLLASGYSFTIKAGHHRGSHDFIARPHLGANVDRSLRFTATFAADAAYRTQSAAEQSDWNKLMGITTDRIHDNSIRIGWRFNPQSGRIELGFYGYLHGTRVMPMLTDVALGQPIDCELRMTNQGLYARAGGASHSEAGSLGVSLPLTWILHSAYFGGPETSPHDLHVDVSNIDAR
jgi:hypothetical protein